MTTTFHAFDATDPMVGNGREGGGWCSLWARLGPLVAHRQVVKDLGGPVYSTPAHHWILAVDDHLTPDDRVAAFGALRLPNDAGVAWLDYVWVHPDRRGAGLWREFYDRRVALAAELEAKTVRTCTRNLMPAFESRGFRTYRTAGAWHYMEKSL